jgi:hypothetical protein
MLLKEILRKEEEKHRLRFIGIITDWDDAVRRTLGAFAANGAIYGENKALLLKVFYGSILAYDKFIRREKSLDNTNLKRHHFMKTSAFVLRMRNTPAEDLDGEMKTGAAITLGYHFSTGAYDPFYAAFAACDKLFASPCDADNFFAAKAAAVYPLNVSGVVERLSDNDASFWEMLARYLKNVSYSVVNYYLQRIDDSGYSAIIKDEVWTNAYEVLRDRFVLRKGNIPQFQTGRDFRNYIIKICKILSANLYKKYFPKEDLLPQYPPGANNDDDDNDCDNDILNRPEDENADPADDFSILDINTDNPYEVAHAVSIILLNSLHPLRPKLVEGIESKVRILIDKAANGMSYKDIIADLYGEQNMSREEFQRAVVKARKDYERVRKILFDRLTGFKKNLPGASHFGNSGHTVINNE